MTRQQTSWLLERWRCDISIGNCTLNHHDSIQLMRYFVTCLQAIVFVMPQKWVPQVPLSIRRNPMGLGERITLFTHGFRWLQYKRSRDVPSNSKRIPRRGYNIVAAMLQACFSNSRSSEALKTNITIQYHTLAFHSRLNKIAPYKQFRSYATSVPANEKDDGILGIPDDIFEHVRHRCFA